jgi:hypothetical protein
MIHRRLVWLALGIWVLFLGFAVVRHSRASF